MDRPRLLLTLLLGVFACLALAGCTSPGGCLGAGGQCAAFVPVPTSDRAEEVQPVDDVGEQRGELRAELRGERACFTWLREDGAAFTLAFPEGWRSDTGLDLWDRSGIVAKPGNDVMVVPAPGTSPIDAPVETLPGCRRSRVLFVGAIINHSPLKATATPRGTR